MLHAPATSPSYIVRDGRLFERRLDGVFAEIEAIRGRWLCAFYRREAISALDAGAPAFAEHCRERFVALHDALTDIYNLNRKAA